MQPSVLPTPWAQNRQWILVIAVILVVISLRPDPATVGACGTMLLAVTEAYHRLTNAPPPSWPN